MKLYHFVIVSCLEIEVGIQNTKTVLKQDEFLRHGALDQGLGLEEEDAKTTQVKRKKIVPMTENKEEFETHNDVIIEEPVVIENKIPFLQMDVPINGDLPELSLPRVLSQSANGFDGMECQDLDTESNWRSFLSFKHDLCGWDKSQDKCQKKDHVWDTPYPDYKPSVLMPHHSWMIKSLLATPRMNTASCLSDNNYGDDITRCLWQMKQIDTKSSETVTPDDGEMIASEKSLREAFARNGCPMQPVAFPGTNEPRASIIPDPKVKVLVILFVKDTDPHIITSNANIYVNLGWKMAFAVTKKDEINHANLYNENDLLWPRGQDWYELGVHLHATDNFPDKWEFQRHLSENESSTLKKFDLIFLPDSGILWHTVDLVNVASEAINNDFSYIPVEVCREVGDPSKITKLAAPIIKPNFLINFFTDDSCKRLTKNMFTEIKPSGEPMFCHPKEVTVTIEEPEPRKCLEDAASYVCAENNVIVPNAIKELQTVTTLNVVNLPQHDWLLFNIYTSIGTVRQLSIKDTFSGKPLSGHEIANIWNITAHVGTEQSFSMQKWYSDHTCPEEKLEYLRTIEELTQIPNLSFPYFMQRREKKLLVILSVAQHRMDIIRANAYHFKIHGAAMVLAHYDSQTDLYSKEKWYQDKDLVVFTRSGNYRGKFVFLEWMIKNQLDLLKQYEHVLLPDSDFLWTPVNLTCYVKKAKKYGMVGPATVGRHRVREQDVNYHKNSKACLERSINDVEVQAPMFKGNDMEKVATLFLKENHDAKGDLESNWCLDYIWCPLLGGCGVYEECGNPIHCNTKTLNKTDPKWISATYQNCRNLKKKFEDTWLIWYDYERNPRKSEKVDSSKCIP